MNGGKPSSLSPSIPQAVSSLHHYHSTLPVTHPAAPSPLTVPSPHATISSTASQAARTPFPTPKPPPHYTTSTNPHSNPTTTTQHAQTPTTAGQKTTHSHSHVGGTAAMARHTARVRSTVSVTALPQLSTCSRSRSGGRRADQRCKGAERGRVRRANQVVRRRVVGRVVQRA